MFHNRSFQSAIIAFSFLTTYLVGFATPASAFAERAWFVVSVVVPTLTILFVVFAYNHKLKVLFQEARDNTETQAWMLLHLIALGTAAATIATVGANPKAAIAAVICDILVRFAILVKRDTM